MRRSFFLHLYTILVLGGIVGCSDDPNAVGIHLIPGKDAVTIDSLKIPATVTSTDTARVRDNSTTLLLGKYQHYEARTLFQFSGIPTNLPSAMIDSAVLQLRINYRFKDSTGFLGFEIHQMTQAWSQSSYTWDSLQPGSNYTLASDTTILVAVGAMDTALSIRIDPVIRSWFRDSANSVNGMILLPSPFSNSNIILGFSNYISISGDFRPLLTIVYRDSVSDTSSTTLILDPVQSLSLANYDLPPPAGKMDVQAGIAYRGKLQFSFPSILRGTSITSATMALYLDAASSLRNSFTNATIVARLALDTTSSPALSSLSSSGAPVASDSTRFTFDVRNFVQQWTKGTANYGVVLQAINEVTSLDNFVFYGAAADTAHRPKLQITYTSFPTKRR